MFVGGLYMKNNSVLKLTMTAIMAALCYVAFSFLQIKIPTPVGYTSFHLGNTFCALAALLLGGLPGGIAGAIGMGIGDLLDPVYVSVAPKTIILKLGIGLVTGYLAHKVFKIKDKESKELFKSTVLSVTGGMVFNLIGETLISYLYYLILLGNAEKAISYLALAKFVTTTVNGVLAIIIASAIYIALYPRLKNNGTLDKIGPKY